MSLYDLVMKAGVPKGKYDSLTKQEFGRVMHDPDATEEAIQSALEMLQQAGGYENLGD